MKKEKNRFPIIWIVVVVIILAAFLVISYIYKSISESNYFDIKEIVAKGNEKIDLSYLKGKSIIKLDLSRESRKILDSCVDCSQVVLVRALPSRLYVGFIKRKPLALVKFYRYFAVDEQGVFFSVNEDPLTLGLPVIYGLETKIFGPKLGKQNNVRELSLVIDIITQMRRNRPLKDFKIERINVLSVENIELLISSLQAGNLSYANWQAPTKKDPLEVKIGQNNIKEKVAILGGLINQNRNNLDNIKYIDLRFKEPVIKFKEINAK